MVPQTRRRLLQIGAGLLTGLSGCSTFQEEPPAPSRLLELLALNYTTSEQTLHILIEEDEEFVYHESHQLAPGEPTDVTVRRFKELPQEPDEYVLTAWLDDHVQSSSSRLDVSEYDVDCMKLRVFIESTDGSENPDIGIAFMTADCPSDGAGEAQSGEP